MTSRGKPVLIDQERDRLVQALQDIIVAPDRATQIAEAALTELVGARMGLVHCPEGRIPVMIPVLEDGQRGWAKWVVGTNKGERGGFLFSGPFLPRGRPAPLPIGAVVVVATGAGRSGHVNYAEAYVVQQNGALGGGVSANRACWDELATALDKYLRARADEPLLTPLALAPPQFGAPVSPP